MIVDAQGEQGWVTWGLLAAVFAVARFGIAGMGKRQPRAGGLQIPEAPAADAAHGESAPTSQAGSGWPGSQNGGSA